jgi:hypothetical protein
VGASRGAGDGKQCVGVRLEVAVDLGSVCVVSLHRQRESSRPLFKSWGLMTVTRDCRAWNLDPRCPRFSGDRQTRDPQAGLVPPQFYRTNKATNPPLSTPPLGSHRDRLSHPLWPFEEWRSELGMRGRSAYSKQSMGGCLGRSAGPGLRSHGSSKKDRPFARRARGKGDRFPSSLRPDPAAARYHPSSAGRHSF